MGLVVSEVTSRYAGMAWIILAAQARVYHWPCSRAYSLYHLLCLTLFEKYPSSIIFAFTKDRENMIKDAATLAELRVLVGYLGEQSSWWSSHFFGPSALAFLTPVFGRSARQAQYQGVLEAARRVHDEYIGIGRTLHLFHMLEHYEQGTASLVADRERVEALFAHIQSPESAQARLETLASPQEAKEGPVVVGDLDDTLTVPLATMAGLYLDALRRGIQTHPYLREAQ